MEKKSKAKPKPKVTDFSNVYSKHLKGLSSSKTPDLEIHINNEILKVHKIILASGNEVFKAMLDSQMAESKNNRLEITDCDLAAFKVFLANLYTSQVPEEDISFNLLVIAEKYLDLKLKKRCLQKLSSGITVENIVKTAEDAAQFNSEELIIACQQFFTENYMKFIDTPQLEAILENKKLVAGIFKEYHTFSKKLLINSKKHKFLLGGVNVLLKVCEFCKTSQYEENILAGNTYCCKAYTYGKKRSDYADPDPPDHSLTFFADDVEWSLKVTKKVTPADRYKLYDKPKETVVINLKAKDKKVVADVQLKVLSRSPGTPHITFEKQNQSFGKRSFEVFPFEKLVNNKAYVKRNTYFTVKLFINVLSVKPKERYNDGFGEASVENSDLDSYSGSESDVGSESEY